MGNDDQFLFSDHEEETETEERETWKVLIVDDDADIHKVTQFVLNDFEYLGKKLNLLNAYSAAEAKEVFAEHDDIAVVFLDVVMESNHAGLDLVDWLRVEQSNKTSRIILRTGQPGDAPESEVIKKYEINDYKNKTELTATKLNTTLCAALRSYRDIMVIENTKKGLNTIINSSASILVEDHGAHWLDGILSQLSAILHLGEVHAFNFAAQEVEGKWQVVASSEGGEGLIGKDLNEFIHCSVDDVTSTKDRFIQVKVNKSVGLLVVHCPKNSIEENIEILDIFIRNITIAYEKVILLNEVRDTQKEIAYRLGEVVETRSKESGSHVKRVAEIWIQRSGSP
jgi:response regulator RpfG family c-di-GMP phosphodiesterase